MAAKTAAQYIESVHAIAYDWRLHVHIDLVEDWSTLYRQLRQVYGHWARTLEERRKWQRRYNLPFSDGYRGQNKRVGDPLKALAGIISQVKRRALQADPADRWADGIAARLVV